jgi:hypothetical protein
MKHNPRKFWNLSNHPWETSWGEVQQQAARLWADPVHQLVLYDVPFPFVDPEAEEDRVLALVDSTLEWLKDAGFVKGEPILVQGEFSLVVALVPRLKELGLIPLCATTRRIAKEELQSDESVIRSHIFQFVQFRNYF